MSVEVVTSIRGKLKTPKIAITVESPDYCVEEVRTAVQRSLTLIKSATGQQEMALEDKPNGKAKGKTVKVDGNGVVRTATDETPPVAASA